MIRIAGLTNTPLVWSSRVAQYAPGAASVRWMMFDWNAELEVAKRQVADLEEKVARFREEMQRIAEDPTQATPIERILERNQRMLSVKMASLDRAKLYARFVEQKVAAGATVAKQWPDVDLAEV